MAECTRSQALDPVQGLIDYTLLTKPYHSKILEVLVEYIHTDCIDVTITENWWLSAGMPDPSLLCLWGWTEEQAARFFNCEWELFQVSGVDCDANYVEVNGDKSGKFVAGDEILVRTDEFVFYKFTVGSILLVPETSINIGTTCEDGSPPPDCETFNTTDCAWTPGSPDTQPPRVGRVVKCRSGIQSSNDTTKTRIYVNEMVNSIFPCVDIPISGVDSVFRNVGNSSPFLQLGSPERQVRYYWEVDGARSELEPGDVFSVTGDSGIADANYTVFRTEYDKDSAKTRIFVVNDLSAAVGDGTINLTFRRGGGVVYPAGCWTHNEAAGTYSFNAGLVWPSHVYVDKNRNCGGYGFQFEHLLGSVDGIANTILAANTESNYYEIDNLAGLPADVSSWEQVFKYGVKFEVVGSTANDGIHTILTAQVVYSGSPINPTQRLRIYTIGNVSSAIVDGEILLRKWGYDEPAVCVDQGQSLGAYSHIAEDFLLTLNENGAGVVLGWDMQHWDIAGWDGGSFTYTLTHT